MRLLSILFLLISINTFAQSYSDQIAKHREEYKHDFIKDNNSPLKKKDLQNLHFYEADSTYKILADVEILKNEKVFKMPTYDGTSSDYFRYAQCKLQFRW
jgi:aspartate carbamoyltransferase regulatory subunit